MSDAAKIKKMNKLLKDAAGHLIKAQKAAHAGTFVAAIRHLLRAAAVSEEMRDIWIESGLRWSDPHPIAEMSRHMKDLVDAVGEEIGLLAEGGS